MILSPSIFKFIEEQESAFDTDEVSVLDNDKFNLKRHINMSLALIRGIFVTGENNWLRPFKKVIQPILNIRYRAEDIELKNVSLYVENDSERVSSFFIKKYHDEVYVKKHDLDSFFDEAGRENITLGGVLVQKGKDGPEVLPLQFIAFCDQTDILGGPIGFKYYFSPDKLRGMTSLGWGSQNNGATVSLDELITLAQFDKDPLGRSEQKKNKTTGKNIEVYIIHGSLPEHYLKDNNEMDNFFSQLHIVAFYKDKKNNRIGVTLYRKKENEDSLLFFTSEEIRGRGVGEGGAEALFNEQIWTNFLEIHKMRLLEAGAKNVLYTDDPQYTNRQKIVDMESNEITTIADNKRIYRVPTENPVSVQLFEKSVNEWFVNAQLIGSAQDPLLGRQSFSGQTFRGQATLLNEGKSMHEYRRGKFAKFIEQVYRKMIIPDIKKEILKGKKFLTTLTSEEMQWVGDRIAENKANRAIIDSIFDNKQPEDRTILVQRFKDEFTKKGNKHLLEFLKYEFKDIEILLDIDIVGKQKNLSELSDKVAEIFKMAFTNPANFQAVMQIPGMSQAFNDILQYSGISEVDFASLPKLPQPAPQLPPSANSLQPPQPPQPQNVVA